MDYNLPEMIAPTFSNAASSRFPEPLPDLLHLVRRWLVSPRPLAQDEHDLPFDHFNIYNGPCGYIQCMLGYRLQDMGHEVQAFAVQSLPGIPYGHVALTLPLKDRWYLVDPSFWQFLRDDEEGYSPNPATCLSYANLEMAQDLRRYGMTVLTPSRAAQYIAAFQRSGETRRPAQAFAFLTSPPPSTMNWWFPRDHINAGLAAIGAPLLRADVPQPPQNLSLAAGPRSVPITGQGLG